MDTTQISCEPDQLRAGPVPLPAELAIHVEGLRCRYGAYEAVRGIDLAVRHGEVFALLGTNGAGKTTTLEARGASVRQPARIRCLLPRRPHAAAALPDLRGTGHRAGHRGRPGQPGGPRSGVPRRGRAVRCPGVRDRACTRTTETASVTALPGVVALLGGAVWALSTPRAEVGWLQLATGGGAIAELARLGWDGLDTTKAAAAAWRFRWEPRA